MVWVGFYGGVKGGRVYLLTELRVFGRWHLVSCGWVKSEVD